MNEEPEEWVVRNRLAQLLGVSQNTIDGLRTRNLLQFERRGHRYWYNRKFAERVQRENGFYEVMRPKKVRPRWWNDPNAVAKLQASVDALDQQIMNLSKTLGAWVTTYKRARAEVQKIHNEYIRIRLRHKHIDRMTREALAAIEAGNVVLMHKGDMNALREKLVPPEYIERQVQARLTAMRIGQELRQESVHG